MAVCVRLAVSYAVADTGGGLWGMANDDKQALIIIHGVGEQRPMDTLRSFVDAVWTYDPSVHHRHGKAAGTVWSKPDDASGSFELRRLTTGQNAKGLKTDFFEFYWAHMMQGTTLSQVTGWMQMLLLRQPSTVPPQLKAIWLLLLTGLVVAVGLIVYGTVYGAVGGGSNGWSSLILGMVLVPLLEFIARKIVGDAARYLNPAPANISSRQRIRSAGVDLLQTLHDRGYRRIIVVGHSLGTVIGYDMLIYAWARHNDLVDGTRPKQNSALEALEKAATASQIAKAENIQGKVNEAGFPTADYQVNQGAYAAELREAGNSWRVTDFVTLGSPLAHASVLLAQDEMALRAKQADRELPTCPPTLENKKSFSFAISVPAGKRNARRKVPHHAAPFGPTRWTNLYFPARAVIWGDIIAGPLRNVMGPGVRDVRVRTQIWRGLFSHTSYWTLPKGRTTAHHVKALRLALRLGEDS
jgi:hypothetical protein